MTENSPAPLAIVGIGCLFPKADGPGAFWANVKHGVDGISDVPTDTHWNPADYFDADPKAPDMTYARRGGFLSAVPFNPLEFGIPPRDIEATDTSQLLGLVAAKMALNDAGIKFKDQVLAPSPLAGEGGGGGSALPSPSDPHPNPPPSQGEGTKALVDRNRVSVILGVTGTLELVVPLGARLGHPKWKQAMKDAGIPDDAAEDAAARISESYVPWQENSFPGLLGNVVAGRIANKLDLGGTNCVVDAACASSLSAVHLAALELQAGRCDVAVTGGVDTFNDIFMFMCFSKTPALSPTGNAKPFDAAGDGTILGEGLGIVVLKRLADAERDGDRVYAVIRGIGSSSDGKGNAIYAPSAAGQKKCLETAYKLAGVTPDTIELVEAHGTGTKVGDTVEATALCEVYTVSREAQPSGSTPWCAVGSVKSQIGHTKAAAGSASLIKAALAVYNKVLPPTLKVTQPVDPFRAADSPFYVNAQMRPWLPKAEHPRRAALSAFGFGGSNFHAVLEEHRPGKVQPDWDGSVEILALSGDSAASITGELDRIGTLLTPSPLGGEGGGGGYLPAPSDPHPNPPPSQGEGTKRGFVLFARAAEASRSTFQADARCRLVLVAQRDATDLPKLLSSVKAKLAAEPDAKAWHTPDGAFYGTGPAPGGVGVLFPGQGSQAVGMLRDLTCLFPEMLDALAAANEPIGDARLSERIYPPTSFDPAAKQHQEAALRSTDVAQPAIGAVSFGAWKVLSERFGVEAAAFAGHSYGELVALAAAGRLSPDELVKLSRLRGRLMAEQRAGDPGGMLAVFAPLDDIEAVIASAQLQVVVANKNAPNQTVLSGSSADIAAADSAFTERQIRSVRLPVSAAFHSPLVADAAVPFREALESVAFPDGTRPVFANTTATEYPSDPVAARDLLGNQLAKPVAFADEIRAMIAAGVRTFVEVGPGSVLTRLAEATISGAGGPELETFSLDASSGRRPGVVDLAQLLARLAARGHAVRLAAWEAGSRCRPAPDPRPGPTVPLCGANYVNPRPKRPARAPIAAPAPTDNRPTPRPGASEMPDPTPAPSALQVTQQTLAALQRMQEDTARLHRQFLESQEQAQRTLFALVTQQQALLFPGGIPAAPAAAPVPAPFVPPAAPVPPAPPAYAATPAIPAAAIIRPAVPASPPPARVPTPPPPKVAPAPAPAPVAKAPDTNGHAKALPAVAPDVEKTLLAVVAEKTGYPADMLTLDMALDADLGVDSIKRVEILSALQEKLPAAPVVKPEHLGTLHTLRDVANFLAGGTTSSFHELPGIDSFTRPDGVESPSTLNIAGPIEMSGGDSMYPIASGDPATLGVSAPNAEEVQQTLLAVVAEKTGYPADMLTLDMALDADLGVDSIKRVEILSALQEKLPAAPVVKPEHLGTLHTLRDVANFLARPTGSPSTANVPLQRSPSESGASAAGLTAKLPPLTASPPEPQSIAADPFPTFADAVNPLSALPAATPVNLPTLPPPPAAPASKPTPEPPAPESPRSGPFETLRAGSQSVNLDRVERSILQAVDLDPGNARARIPLAAGGEVWVVAPDDAFSQHIATELGKQGLTAIPFPWADPEILKPSGNPVGLVLVAPARTAAGIPLNRIGFRWLQNAGPKLRAAAKPGGAAVFATVARLDGAFGLGDLSPDTDPTAGGLAGLAKTARHEWPEVAHKAIDVAPEFADADPTQSAAAVTEEILFAGPVEVGVSAEHRCTLELVRTVRRQGTTAPVFGPRDVVIVTGGARGVTAEAAVALAEVYQPTLILTGRTPPFTGPEPDWIRPHTDEAAMKKAIADHLGANATPKAVGEYYAKVLGQREIARNLARVEAAGSKVAYFPMNITTGKQVADLLHKVQVKFGPVTGLVHGAGVLADRKIEDLSPDQFDLVYSTKVDGLRHLLDLLGHQELKAVVLFSSSTGRYGRTGQLAYAAANEVLNKTAQVEARKRPTARVVAINWGPWGGGMVTPALKKMFESEGIGLIPLQEGGLFAVQELTATGRAVEVVAAGKLRSNKLATATMGTPGMPASPAISTEPGTNGSGPSSGGMPPTPELAVVFERQLDIPSHPVLRSHVLDGRAVLPMALHMEWLAHAALHGNPGLVFHGFNDLRITHGVMVEDGNTTTLKVLAGKASKHDKSFHVPVELRGKRRDGREAIHSRAEVVLTAALPKPPFADKTPDVQPYPHPIDEVYRYFLFHGPELHAIERIDGLTDTAFVATAYPAPAPSEWFTSPLRSAWVADPLVIDAAFQMMILWSFAQHGAGSLPCFAGRYRQFRRAFPAGPVKVVIRVTRDNGSFARSDIDFLDSEGLVIAQMQDYECVIDRQLDQAFRRNQLAPRVRQ